MKVIKYLKPKDETQLGLQNIIMDDKKNWNYTLIERF